MSEQSTPVLAITGGTGFVGSAIARNALDRGWTVRALARDEDKAAERLPAECQVVFGDIFDQTALERLLIPESGPSATAIAHTIGIRRELGPGNTYDRMHRQATERIIEAAQRAGIGRFIHVSALGTRPNAPTGYHKSKYNAEVALRESTLQWTILRPSIIHGPDGEFIQMVQSWVLGRSQPFFFLPYFTRVSLDTTNPFVPPTFTAPRIAPVDVRDVANAATESIVRPEAVGEVYELVGPDTYEWPHLLTTIRDNLPMTDSSKKPLGIPAPLGVIAAIKAKIFGIAGLLPFGPSEPIMGSEDSLANAAKAFEQINFQPRAFEPALVGYADRI